MLKAQALTGAACRQPAARPAPSRWPCTLRGPAPAMIDDSGRRADMEAERGATTRAELRAFTHDGCGQGGPSTMQVLPEFPACTHARHRRPAADP
jgi:hypothetical protein